MTGSIDVGASDLGRETQGAGFDGPALVSSTRTGLMSAADKVKLDGIEAGATGDQTPTEILTAIKTVDGAGTGLDADLLDGQHGSYFQQALTNVPGFEIGGSLTGDRNSYIDFHSEDTNADFSARIIRNPGVNGSLSIQSLGTGGITFSTSGSFTLNGSTVWTAANDGAASGLDADLLDGQQGSFYQNATNLNAGTIADARLPVTQTAKTFTGTLTISNSGPMLYMQDVDASAYDFWVHANSNNFYVLVDRNNDGTWEGPHALQLDVANSDAYAFGNLIWTSANDGSGSGLDADMLDGSQGSAVNAVNTVPIRDASGDITTRLFRSEYNSTAGSTGAYFVTQNALGAGADNYLRPIPAASAVADIVAAMGTGAIGTYAMCVVTVASPSLVPGQTIAGSSLKYSNVNQVQTSSVLSGTWRTMGVVGGTGITTLFLRIA
jgi:hypothetical protein